MKSYLMSALFLSSMALSLWSMASALDRFNQDLAKAMFNVPVRTVAVAVIK